MDEIRFNIRKKIYDNIDPMTRKSYTSSDLATIPSRTETSLIQPQQQHATSSPRVDKYSFGQYAGKNGAAALSTTSINVRPSSTLSSSRTPRNAKQISTCSNNSSLKSSSATSPKQTSLLHRNEVDISPSSQDLLKPVRDSNLKKSLNIDECEATSRMYITQRPDINKTTAESEMKPSVSKLRLTDGFDLETIDLTNDADRKVIVEASKKYQSEKDEYENTDEQPASSLSSSDEDEDGRSDSDPRNNNNNNDSIKNNPARRYISVESLVLEDNFDARSNRPKPSSGSDEDLSGMTTKSDDEIPLVKVVWTTPPEGSPRGNSSKPPQQQQSHQNEIPLRTRDDNHLDILNFFTRSEDGNEKEGRLDNVESVVNKFFTQTTEEESEKVTKCINLKQVMDNVDEFILQPAAIGYDVQCRVTRDRKGVDRGLYPTYYMHLERPDGRKILLLTGRKRKKSTTSNYLISTDASDLSRDSSHFVGKVRSNILGTQFTIYDNGQSQKRFGLFQSYGTEQSLREELAAVIYEPNVLGFKGPRKMKILIPEMKNEAKRREHRPEKEKDSILELHKQDDDDQFFELRNKAPIWNDDNQSFVLNFHGRVTQASVKNFQIIHENKDDYVILQFGRVASDLFTMDYRYPLCALQAFAIVLTSFDNKLACE